MMNSVGHPACDEFARLAYLYVTPPTRDGRTRAFAVIERLHSALSNLDFCRKNAIILKNVKVDLDEAITAAEKLFKQIRDAYATVKRSTAADTAD
jgi:hypothetical protein